MNKQILKFSLFLAIWSATSLFSAPIKDHLIDQAALSELAGTLQIPSDADLVAETQKKWLRKSGQERWEVAELSTDQKAYVLDWAVKQGFFIPWKPAASSYDKALILGATDSRMEMRLNFLKELWNEGVRFQEIVWLTGDRPLDPRVDRLADRCKLESEAARIIWEESDLPKEMRAVNVLFIAAPMKQEGASLARPNTKDTLVAWLNHSPVPCKALFISDQPFCGYQFAVIKDTLPDAFAFDVAGQGADPLKHPSSAAVTLDSIARWIYLEDLIAKKQEKNF